MFKLGNLEVGINSKPLVIPEIGINHGGDLKVAKQMVDAAHKSGALLVKHQTHIVEDEMSDEAKNVIPGNSKISIYDVMKQCSLDYDEEKELKRYVEEKGMIFISTPFSRAAADRLEDLGVVGYKIGSGELNNYPLIRHIAEFKKPMIVSTGMNDISSIETAVNIMESAGVKYALLHTTNLYPTLPEQVRLGAMTELMKAFPGVPIGLSDHTLNNNACIAAIGLGASIVERHFTDTKNRTGNDIICSMDELDLKNLIEAADEVYLMRGGQKKAIPEEQVTIKFAFATVISIQDIKLGQRITKDNIWVKRPGTGEIPAKDYDFLLGKTAKCNIPKGIHLKYDMIN